MTDSFAGGRGWDAAGPDPWDRHHDGTHPAGRCAGAVPAPGLGAGPAVGSGVGSGMGSAMEPAVGSVVPGVGQPDAYREFARRMLALHQVLPHTMGQMPMCSCGSVARICPVVNTAHDLLGHPVPWARPAAGPFDR